MSEMIQSYLEQIDTLFRAADIDYQILYESPIDITLFEEYDRQRIVNSFLFNFIKLQDKIGAKLFRKVLAELRELEDPMSMRDMLDRFEQLQIIDSVETWDRLREIRNAITHEYPMNLEERIENIRYALQSYNDLKKIYRNIRTVLIDQ